MLLNDPGKASAPRSIYLVGAPCTGKTTILNALRQQYTANHTSCDFAQPAYIIEVARRLLGDLQIDREDIGNSPAKCLKLQEAILQAQYRAELASPQDASSWYISDRSGLDPIVFTQLYVGSAAADKLLASPTWEALELNMKQGLVFLCESGCSWLTDDGVRLMPRDMNEWLRFDQTFEQLLEARGIHYVRIPAIISDVKERVGLVISSHRRR
ncbi:uncharacterized protein RCC_06715 [Ramularia collo-cygni]|uniref:NadR/Ttd14 AAA domain-containing protein n=1 Tax=Ramularia collo-cygni TaxID=112498 RepID=A0A2D3V2B8_9PEZI|nr:uncharacterized protein RCC_06715 [Ramularia collo-cygni]CZT20855.1 uncharacterized protein RCC_06715 [Ramularia collo-cygni]